MVGITFLLLMLLGFTGLILVVALIDWMFGLTNSSRARGGEPSDPRGSSKSYNRTNAGVGTLGPTSAGSFFGSCDGGAGAMGGCDAGAAGGDGC